MNIDIEKTKEAFSVLEEIYREIPQTKGCGKANSPKGCKGWCCYLESPSMFNVEFIYLWQTFEKNNSHEQQTEIITKAVKNYLRTSMTKECVFFDKRSSSCLCHKARPFICRLYGIIHPRNWKKRISTVKQQSVNIKIKDRRDLSLVLKQCDKVRTQNGHRHSGKENEEKWFERIKDAEEKLGIPRQIIDVHDAPGGPYRAIHDHIMLNVFPVEQLSSLSSIRENHSLSEEEIIKFANKVKDGLNNVS